MPNTRDGIARAIEKRSPVDIDGTSFTLTLTELKKSLPHEVKYIEVLFMALSTDARHNGMLHIGPDNYTDDEIADLAVNTIRDIVRGKLPPSTPLLSESPSVPFNAARAEVVRCLQLAGKKQVQWKMVKAAGTQRASD